MSREECALFLFALTVGISFIAIVLLFRTRGKFFYFGLEEIMLISVLCYSISISTRLLICNIKSDEAPIVYPWEIRAQKIVASLEDQRPYYKKIFLFSDIFMRIGLLFFIPGILLFLYKIYDLFCRG